MTDPAVLARLAALEARCAALEASRVAPAPAGAPAGPQGGRVASDRELDDPQWGDEIVKKDPPRWRGAPESGQRMSACTPDYLECLADFHDWCAERDRAAGTPEKARNARYSETRAAKARGWAKRVRARVASTAPLDDSEVPF